MRYPARGPFDFEVEGAFQRGTSRLGTGLLTELNHSAWFSQFSLGTTPAGPWTPKLAISYRQASGDRSPTDQENKSFAPFFGARRFELGPTGILGAIQQKIGVQFQWAHWGFNAGEWYRTFDTLFPEGRRETDGMNRDVRR